MLISIGDIAQWMLVHGTRYAFIFSSDEIMFLRYDIEEKTCQGKTVIKEPWLNYTKPMKITAALDPEEKTVTVRMGLMYLFWLAVQNERKTWCLPDDIGNAANYAVYGKLGEDLQVRRPGIPK